MVKKKKDKRGGSRPGAGRKETGINWVHFGTSVHKDDYNLIKELVKSKKKELNDARKSKETGAVTEQVEPIPVKAGKIILKPEATTKKAPEAVNKFLEQRRNSKGIKP